MCGLQCTRLWGNVQVVFDTLAETPDFIVVTKPAGMETVSQDGGPELARQLRLARNEPALAPVHRLDRDTSGAQTLARNPAAEKKLAALFRQREVEKTYLALCLGVPRNREGTVNRNLSEWDGGRRPVRVVKKGGLAASTAYRVLAASGKIAGDLRISVIAFFPHQGRTHQIRVHAAAIGYPILADDQYGDRPANRIAKVRLGLNRQALHSWRIAFPWNGKAFAAVSPPVEDLREAVRRVFGDDGENEELATFFP